MVITEQNYILFCGEYHFALFCADYYFVVFSDEYHFVYCLHHCEHHLEGPII